MAPEQQQAKIFVEKRKKGKVVTVIDSLVLTQKDLKALGKKLKVACGVGGTVSEQHIELQGDCLQKAKAWLEKNHWGIRG